MGGGFRSKHILSSPQVITGVPPAKVHSIMASRRNSSSRSSGSKPGDWESCTIPHSELMSLQANGYLPQAHMVSVRAGLATYNGGKQAEGTPNPSKGERVCFVP